MTRKTPILVLLFIIFSFSTYSQNREIHYQSLRGIVYNAITQQSVGDVNILLQEKEEIVCISDTLGRFKLQSPVGRKILVFSHVNYISQSICVLVRSGQESDIKIFLEPNISQLSEVVIQAPFRKEKPINNLIYTSGRSFSTDEANQYAGTLGDPARMVQSYAGVTAAQDDRNDIIIRGNSPTGVQWKLNDIEIPNPNHYGGIGLTGNQVTLLNMNMIDNSDFLTGAFPAEYGNVSSGVFDLKLKEGNTDKHEFRLQTGWNGFEMGAEGPFSKKKNMGSHTTCYRYSFLDLISKMGVNVGIIPQYQDFTTNLHFNLSKKTELSVLGLWGTSQIEMDDHTLKDLQSSTGDYVNTGSDLLLLGANVLYKINPQSKLKFSLSVLQNEVNTQVDTFNVATDASGPVWYENSTENKYSFFTEYTSRAIKNNFLKVGLRFDNYDVNYKQNGINKNNIFTTLTNSSAALNLMRLYTQDEYRFNHSWKATLGVNYQHLFYNNSYSIEPRVALQYRINQKQNLAFAYGMHSQMQPRTVYFVETASAHGAELTNENLDFSRAQHYVLSYNYMLNKNLRLKMESYYQDLYDIPVKDNPTSMYSILNTGVDYYLPLEDSLINKGKGRNYGLEMTLEKFLSNNYYYMLSGSVFSSEYTGGDGVWRSTSFDMSYILNGLFGYEWWVTSNFALGADIKMTWAGGKPYIPVNEQKSISDDNVIYDYNRAYDVKYDDYFRTDFKLFYRSNLKSAFLEFAIDFQNLTNHKNIYSKTFEPETGEYKIHYQRGFFPMYTFKLLF